MAKFIGFLAFALLAAGCSGSSNGTTSGGSSSGGSTGSSPPNTLTGQFAFPVGKAIDVEYGLLDGGIDPTYLEVDITNDATDSCLDQEGHPDGGYPEAKTKLAVVIVFDPMGVDVNLPYTSLTEVQEDNLIADGGAPSTAFAQVLYQDAMTNAVSILGTVTLLEDPTTEEVDTDFSVTLLEKAALATQSILAGNGTPPLMCAIEFEED